MGGLLCVSMPALCMCPPIFVYVGTIPKSFASRKNAIAEIFNDILTCSAHNNISIPHAGQHTNFHLAYTPRQLLED